MSKASTLCILSLLLLMMSLLYGGAVARPVATYYDVTPMETQPGRHSVNISGVEREDAIEMSNSCEGLGEDECMMRRTLEAHIDYIYTQKQNP